MGGLVAAYVRQDFALAAGLWSPPPPRPHPRGRRGGAGGGGLRAPRFRSRCWTLVSPPIFIVTMAVTANVVVIMTHISVGGGSESAEMCNSFSGKRHDVLMLFCISPGCLASPQAVLHLPRLSTDSAQCRCELDAYFVNSCGQIAGTNSNLARSGTCTHRQQLP